MLDICKPLLSEECLIGGVITSRETRSGALDIIDTVTDVHRVPYGIFDLSRYSCGSNQRVRMSGTPWRSGWNEPVNVNVKNTGVAESLVVPLSRSVSAVPGNHTVLSDARVVIGAGGASAANRPALRRVCDLVCLRIIYDNTFRMQVGERKEENERRCEREARTCRCTKGTYISQHSERWYRRVGESKLGLLGLSRSTKKQK